MSKEIAICKKDPNHDKFNTTAHVMQSWTVDRDGDFLEVEEECLQVSFGPDRDNEWTCAICGGDVTFITVND